MLSFSRRIYYALKPYLPWRMRMALRRMYTRRKRAVSHHIWPIDAAAATVPAGWSGWPDGRKFSFVITHDVECGVGLAKCRQLAELEMAHGFRSSFNFIPEGDYRVSAEFRTWLTEHGFEVGIHDLHHDGKLYESHAGFLEKAVRINRYAKEWGTVGFRAGFMIRNLEWLHNLDVEYDASTFDTDPFEPQPDGARTIFPFWIPPPQNNGSVETRQPSKKSGYAELPYTLAQDSTLFLLLNETTPEIWLRKLDWIAAHGGMALVNIHPDYVHFGPGTPPPGTYPASHCAELLSYVRDKYPGAYWHALPRDVAKLVRPTIPA